MIKNLEVLEKTMKLPEGTLKSAIENEAEVEVEIPELVVMTKEEDATRHENMKQEFNKAGLEIGIKGAREELKLDFKGKTMDNLLEAHKVKVLEEASIKPDEKIKGLESDKVKLQENITGLQTQIDESELKFKTEANIRTVNDKLLSAIAGETIISKSEILTIFNSKHDSSLNDKGVLEIKKDGALMKHKTTLDPLPIKDVMTDFLTPYLKKASGGAGKGDGTGGAKAGSMDAFIEEQEKLGNRPGSEVFNREMNKRISDKTLKV